MMFDGGIGFEPATLGKKGLRALLNDVIQHIAGILSNTLQVNVVNTPLEVSKGIGEVSGVTLTTTDTEQVRLYYPNGSQTIVMVQNIGSSDAVVRIDGGVGGAYSNLFPDTTIPAGSAKHFLINGPWYRVAVYYRNAVAGSSTSLNIYVRWI